MRTVINVGFSLIALTLFASSTAFTQSDMSSTALAENSMPSAGIQKSVINGRVFGSGKPLGSFREHSFHGRIVPHMAERKGLAVIADFANARLEDWQGPGINNVAELEEQLRKMEEHWAWLSRGLERFQWDIIRVILPVNLQADAYPSWVDYRNAVGTLIRQQVDVSAYDGNHDGVVDSAWIIASNNGMGYEYLIGGASRNAEVNLFVDGQNSESIVVGATGNFNHETAHTVGIPDLYGPYDTLHYLTLMSDSWALPPQDFTAYERTLLEWVQPRVIGQGRRQVHLSSNNQRMEAVRVSTSRASEYFLIEYRHRPDSGFGSNAPPYNGLAVYHVLEGSSQWVDPPLLKLEAADGYIAPDTPPALDDFLYPENPTMRRPFVLRSYFGDQEVLRIDNLQWARDGGLVFTIDVSPLKTTPVTNLLTNPSFEQGATAVPDAWQPDAFEPSAIFTWITQRPVREGKRSVSISAVTPNDARWIQTVSGLNSGQSYELCGWIRGENIAISADAPVGANVSVMGGFIGSESRSGTFDWSQACVIFRPEETSATVACRLGFYGSTVTGQVWCDNMSLVPLRSAFN